MYKNIFISQPMTGKSEEEILATRQKEIDKIHQFFNAEGVEINIITSYIDDATRKHFQKYTMMILIGIYFGCHNHWKG